MAAQIKVDANLLFPGIQIIKAGCGLDIYSGNTVLRHIPGTDIAQFAEGLSSAQVPHEVTKPDLVITIMSAMEDLQ